MTKLLKTIVLLSLASLPLGVIGANQAFGGEFNSFPTPTSCADCDQIEQVFLDLCSNNAVPGSQFISLECEELFQILQTCQLNFCQAVGGDMIQMETTSVLAAGAQYTAAWMIPVIVSGIGFAIVIARKF